MFRAIIIKEKALDTAPMYINKRKFITIKQKVNSFSSKNKNFPPAQTNAKGDYKELPKFFTTFAEQVAKRKAERRPQAGATRGEIEKSNMSQTIQLLTELAADIKKNKIKTPEPAKPLKIHEIKIHTLEEIKAYDNAFKLKESERRQQVKTRQAKELRKKKQLLKVKSYQARCHIKRTRKYLYQWTLKKRKLVSTVKKYYKWLQKQSKGAAKKPIKTAKQGVTNLKFWRKLKKIKVLFKSQKELKKIKARSRVYQFKAKSNFLIVTYLKVVSFLEEQEEELLRGLDKAKSFRARKFKQKKRNKRLISKPVKLLLSKYKYKLKQFITANVEHQQSTLRLAGMLSHEKSIKRFTSAIAPNVGLRHTKKLKNFYKMMLKIFFFINTRVKKKNILKNYLLLQRRQGEHLKKFNTLLKNKSAVSLRKTYYERAFFMRLFLYNILFYNNTIPVTKRKFFSNYYHRIKIKKFKAYLQSKIINHFYNKSKMHTLKYKIFKKKKKSVNRQ